MDFLFIPNSVYSNIQIFNGQCEELNRSASHKQLALWR